MEGDDAGNHHEQRNQQLEQAAQQHPLLAFGQAVGAEGALDDVLIGAPIEEVGQNHARKQGGEWGRVGGCADGVQFVGMLRQQLPKPGGEAALPEFDETEHRHQSPDDEQPDAVQGIGDGHRLEAAGDGVQPADQRNEADGENQRGTGAEAQQCGQVEQLQHGHRSGVEHGGHGDQAVA